MKDFEIIPHTADLKIRAYGNSLAQLFEHAAIGMFQAIEPRNSECRIINDRLECPALPVHHDVTVQASNTSSLLVDFLSQLLYLSDVHNEAYLKIIIHDLSPTHIKASVYGISVAGFDVEIKAVTYHDLSIQEKNGHWQTDIVFDI